MLLLPPRRGGPALACERLVYSGSARAFRFTWTEGKVGEARINRLIPIDPANLPCNPCAAPSKPLKHGNSTGVSSECQWLVVTCQYGDTGSDATRSVSQLRRTYDFLAAGRYFAENKARQRMHPE